MDVAALSRLLPERAGTSFSIAVVQQCTGPEGDLRTTYLEGDLRALPQWNGTRACARVYIIMCGKVVMLG